MTEETKHTPGPWVTDGGAYVQALFTPTDGGKPFYHAIAHTGQPLVQPPEMGANSNLISAAPELLEALKLALPLLEASYLDHGKENPENARVIFEALELSRAAIAKARGQ